MVGAYSREVSGNETTPSFHPFFFRIFQRSGVPPWLWKPLYQQTKQTWHTKWSGRRKSLCETETLQLCHSVSFWDATAGPLPSMFVATKHSRKKDENHSSSGWNRLSNFRPNSQWYSIFRGFHRLNPSKYPIHVN